jgi:ArsR family transcriptional regulator, arsenate/arsenite/antimonite-responsive transcriptional repressor
MPTKEALDIETAADVLKLLGDKTRLTMIKIMSEHECCVCEMVDLFHMSQPAISQHVRKLKDSGLIKERRGGQWIYYSLNTQSPYHDFVLEIIKELPSQRYKVEQQGKQRCCN